MFLAGSLSVFVGFCTGLSVLSAFLGKACRFSCRFRCRTCRFGCWPLNENTVSAKELDQIRTDKSSENSIQKPATEVTNGCKTCKLSSFWFDNRQAGRQNPAKNLQRNILAEHWSRGAILGADALRTLRHRSAYCVIIFLHLD